MLQTFFGNLKVIELASVLAGPLVGSFLSELGADVVKIENKISSGDVTRQWKNSKESPESNSSAYYASANYNKTSLLLDFNDPKDLKTIHDLIAGADILISNYQKRVGQKFGLDHETITKQFSNIIYLQLDAYSYDDPRPGFDMVMQADAGYISMCGTDEGDLVKIPVAMMDILASHQMKEGLLLAMLQKSKTGKGSVVMVSLYQAAVSGLINQGANYLNQDIIAKPMGTKHPNIAPYGDMVSCLSGQKILVAVGSDAQFVGLAEGLGIPRDEWLLFSKNSSRLSGRRDLMQLLNHYTNQIGLENLTALLSSKGIPYSMIKDLKKVFEDPLAKEMVLKDKDNMLSISGIAFKLKQASTI